MTVPDLVTKIEIAYDRLAGRLGAATDLYKEARARGFLDKLSALADGFEALGAGTPQPGQSTRRPAAQPPATVIPPAPPAPKAKSKLEQFFDLQAAGKIKESQEFFYANRAALLAEEREANARMTREDLFKG